MNVFFLLIPNFLWLKMASDKWIVCVRVLYERESIGFTSYKGINFTSSSTTFAAILGNFRWQKPLHSTIQWTELERIWCGCTMHLRKSRSGCMGHDAIVLSTGWSIFEVRSDVRLTITKKKKKASFRIEFLKSKVTWDKVLIFFGRRVLFFVFVFFLFVFFCFFVLFCFFESLDNSWAWKGLWWVLYSISLNMI